ncbi:hypothetical protein BX600DRAFT_446829 [Xylariales sp. PMI_506]|nr:hypothetical protein BX600DRAFT_446829 [Xylariales sp. PMI_506]
MNGDKLTPPDPLEGPSPKTENMPLKYTFVIGIGGSTSAGKTTLANILATVFQRAVFLASDVSSAFVDWQSTTTKIVHQDDYLIPSKDQRWPFYVCPEPQAQDLERLLTNRDCIEACRYQDIHAEVHDHNGKLVSQESSASCPARSNVEIASSSPADANSALNQVMERAASELAGHLRKAVASEASKGHKGDGKISLHFVIVEGNLLLARAGAERAQAQGWPYGHPVLSEQESRQRRDGQKAQELLLEALDVRLFLPVDKQTACDRRFMRPEYQARTPENPRGSVPEQHWKTVKYFEEHAWYV